MIDVNCPHCGRVLVGSRQIVALTSGEGGIEVAYVCWCGWPGAERVGGAARARRPLVSSFGNEQRLRGVGR